MEDLFTYKYCGGRQARDKWLPLISAELRQGIDLWDDEFEEKDTSAPACAY